MPYIRFLKKEGYEVHAASFDNSTQKPGLNYDGLDKFYNLSFSREPFKITNLDALKQLKIIIKENNYDIVHCHTPVGGIIGRLASQNFRKKGLKVIYTAHGFHFYKGAPKKNWLIFFPIEKFCSSFTDMIVAINTEDYNFAKKHMKAKRLAYVPGVGIDIDKFNIDKNSNKIRSDLGIPESAYLILSVGELNKNKNYTVVLDALNKIPRDDIYYCICGVGPLKNYLLNYCHNTQMNNRFKLLGYRRDIKDLLKESNLVIQPSMREGLPLSVMEAIASKTDIIASDIRGCRDLVCEEDLFNPKDSDNLKHLIINKLDLKSSNVEKNYMNLQKFNIINVNNLLLNLYNDCLGS